MPTNIAKDILAVVSDQQIYVAKAFLAASSARAQEQSRQDRLDAEAAAAASEAELLAIEAARVRKDASCPSFHSGFKEAKLQVVSVGGGLRYHGSQVSGQVGDSPPFDVAALRATPRPAPAVTQGLANTGPTGAILDDEQQEKPPAEEATVGDTSLAGAEKLLASPFDSARRVPGMNSVPPRGA